ncbi:ATP-binding protein [Streptomyces parvus]|uniref:ATP-binding protein n=1 Tax=Streptomyces parvus TaxID=66428 RepID=UPI002101B095|nr:ATP-binding protein [Streptomyces parvus]MCQ1577157.1 ATP-binding protein [Streptomyces parvus]
MKTIFPQRLARTGESTTSRRRAQVMTGNGLAEGQEKEPMNVQHLTREQPGCSWSHATASHDDAGRGACDVTDSPAGASSPVGSDRLLAGDPARRFQTAVTFPATTEAIPPVRRDLYKLLCKSGLAEVAYIAALAAQELMANAVMHGCQGFPSDTAVTMTATCDGRQLRLTVEDPSTDLPCVRSGSSDAEGGRGMLLVDDFADRWGVEVSPMANGGKAVWMELACAPSEAAA